VYAAFSRQAFHKLTQKTDPSVKPVAQPLRRITFNLRGAVQQKIKELVDMDIIEHVKGPTPWVNPLVIVPKANSEIRLCLDMRQANRAIVRERYPIPTVDEILQGINGSTIFMSATPNALTTREVEEASESDSELKEVRLAINNGHYENCKAYAPIANELCCIGHLVLRGTRIVLPKMLQPRALALAHKGHLGIVGTKQHFRSKVWWPGMDKAAEKYCKACHGCQVVSSPMHLNH
ncbi:hypothetical protein HF521_003896, partial [Silurus meridionalis]